MSPSLPSSHFGIFTKKAFTWSIVDISYCSPLLPQLDWKNGHIINNSEAVERACNVADKQKCYHKHVERFTSLTFTTWCFDFPENSVIASIPSFTPISTNSSYLHWKKGVIFKSENCSLQYHRTVSTGWIWVTFISFPLAPLFDNKPRLD